MSFYFIFLKLDFLPHIKVWFSLGLARRLSPIRCQTLAYNNADSLSLRNKLHWNWYRNTFLWKHMPLNVIEKNLGNFVINVLNQNWPRKSPKGVRQAVLNTISYCGEKARSWGQRCREMGHKVSFLGKALCKILYWVLNNGLFRTVWWITLKHRNNGSESQ